jgi:hypothetical protein
VYFEEPLPDRRVQRQNFGQAIANPVRVVEVVVNRIVQWAGFDDNLLQQAGQYIQF